MNPNKLVKIFKEKCADAPKRVPDYHNALFETLSEIIWKEYEHSIRATNIQKSITEYCDALGEYVYQKSKGKTKQDTDTGAS